MTKIMKRKLGNLRTICHTILFVTIEIVKMLYCTVLAGVYVVASGTSLQVERSGLNFQNLRWL